MVLIIIIALATSALIVLGIVSILHKNVDNEKAILSFPRFILGSLSLQFVLGILANLYQTIPNDKPWLVFHTVGFIIFHTLNAFFLVILSTYLVFYDKKDRKLNQRGFGAIALAFISGIIFVNGGQNDFFSFTMALGFLLAILVFSYKVFHQ